MATLTITWTAPTPAPSSYTVFYRVTGTTHYSTESVTGQTSWTKSGLDCCDGYEGYIKSTCGTNTSAPSDSWSVGAITPCCANSGGAGGNGS